MPQELTTKMTEPLTEGYVRPYELVKVFATAKTGFHKEGEEMEVHPLLAEKLVKSGKATKESKAKK